MNGTLGFLLQGLALGFANGMLPGPTLVLTIAAALRGGVRNGLAVAASPLVTDLPIIVICMTLLAALPAQAGAALSLLGAAVLCWFAYEAVRDARTVRLSDLREGAVRAPSAARSLRQGAVANLLNPAPWMYWITIGGPLLRDAWAGSALHAIAYIVGFYALLVGSKALMAWAAGTGRNRMSDAVYRRMLIAAGVMLLALAFSLVRSAAFA